MRTHNRERVGLRPVSAAAIVGALAAALLSVRLRASFPPLTTLSGASVAAISIACIREASDAEWLTAQLLTALTFAVLGWHARNDLGPSAADLLIAGASAFAWASLINFRRRQRIADSHPRHRRH